jgi:uncharacterized membrane protein YdbT with pleckstrin-like domain
MSNITPRLHWLLYADALIVTAGTVVLAVLMATYNAPAEVYYLCIPSFLTALYLGIKAWWTNFTTEISVTDRKLIVCKGFISRETQEIERHKIAQVSVIQSFWGRIFDFGDILLHDSGGRKYELSFIENPFGIRRALEV